MSVVIAGAGTSGWLTALYAKKIIGDSRDIIVVYDDKLPIIGVGESTTPHFLNVLETVLDISVGELIRNCEATLKNSIKFTNWKGDGSHYYHTFIIHSVDKFCAALSNGHHIDEIDFVSMLCEKNKVPFPVKGVETDIKNYDRASIAVHFNAKLMAEYLQKVGISRGIKTVIGKIEDVKLDDDGYVAELMLDTKRVIKTDFVFDCTGFARLFAGKIYNSPMESYEKILPVKRAMPFFMDKNEETPPYTECIAMKYGWMWKIPVGERFGCGYVFDSDLTTDEDAYNEICEITGQTPEIRKKINFKPGYYTKPFNKNVLALGLAHGFLEPMEATSLLITIEMLRILVDTIPKRDIFNRYIRDQYTEDYNKVVYKFVKNCVDFVYIHYLTPRDDTEFWKRSKRNIPEEVIDTLKTVNEYDITKPNKLITFAPFPRKSYIQCMAGVDYLEKEMIIRNTRECVYSQVRVLMANDNYLTELSQNHDDALTYLTNVNPWWYKNPSFKM